MYGMVNKAVEDMVCLHFGERTWQHVKSQAGVHDELFITNEQYDDAVTYNLVGAASDVLAMDASRVLRAFGEHWVLKTAQESYGVLMDGGGETMREFLLNLPNFHTRVALLFPNLCPPRFACSNVTAHSLWLHYHSSRQGLAPFVEGLLAGLAKRFAEAPEVQHVQRRADGADHDIFALQWPSLAPA